MKPVQWLARLTLALGLSMAAVDLLAHESGHDGHPDGMIVTRHFSGIWDQVDQEAQGLAIQVVEQFDDSRKSVAYWYTYGADRKTAWFVGTGDLVENRIELELFESDDVGFMQDNDAGSDSVESIGSMVIVFESCDGGSVTFDTSDDEVGSGSFRIERLLEIMNTHCTGGISDDMHIDGMFGEQYLALEHIHVSSRRQGLGLVDTELNRMGYQRKIRLRLQHYMVAPDVVHRSNLALTVPSHWAQKTGLRALELPFVMPAQGSHLLWHKSADGDQANRWVRERIIALCS